MFDSEIESVVEHCTIYQYNPNEYVLKEGDHGEEIFVILDGKASIQKRSDQGTIEVQKLKDGDVFGELCIIGEKIRQADIVTSDVSNILEITYQNIFYLFKNKPKVFSIIMLNIARLLTKRLSNSNRIILELNKKNK